VLSVAATVALALHAVVVLDDGERLARDRPPPPGPWPGDAPIELVAAREETLALQVVVDPAAGRVHVVLDGDVPARATTYAERFIEVKRPSGNARERGASLAFAPRSAPKGLTGFVADPLVPADEAERAMWIDLFVPPAAVAGAHEGRLRVLDAGGATLAERALRLRVVDRTLPWPGAAITTFYENDRLPKHGVDEVALRRLLHAHRISAIREITRLDDPSLPLDDRALSGELYADGRGEGIVALGAYGALGDPDPAKIEAVARLAARFRGKGEIFLYAADEDCASPRAKAWRQVVPPGVRVGVTCSVDPRTQDADLVMATADRWRPGWNAWVYNGRRPWAGPMMLDVPAVDLRANAWIAARYGVERWFYWESTYWGDVDPLVVAETFHNRRGDWANGDGVLVYPDPAGGGAPLPSIKLKSLRRGAEDAGWIALARASNAPATDAIVRRAIPRALGEAEESDAPAWQERGAAWLATRSELDDLIEGRAPQQDPSATPERRFPYNLLVAALAVAGVALALRKRGAAPLE